MLISLLLVQRMIQYIYQLQERWYRQISTKKLIASLMLTTSLISQVAPATQVLADEITSIKSSIRADEEEIAKSAKEIEKRRDDTKKRLEKTKKEFEANSKKLDETTQDVIDKQEALADQVRKVSTLEQSGANSLITQIINGKSLSESITISEAAKTVIENNTESLKKLKEEKAALEEDKKALQDQHKDILAMQEILASTDDDINVITARLKVAEIESKIAKASASEKVELLKEKDKAEKAVEEAKSKQAENARKLNEQRDKLEQLEKEQKEQEELAKQASAESASKAADATQKLSAEIIEEAVEGYKDIQPDYSANTGSYPMLQCTWGAKALAPWAGNYWGNGAQWAASAAAAGFKTGKTPKPGAIASWNDGGYGHVAVVYAVKSNHSIRVKEANFNGSAYAANPAGIQDYRGWFDPTATTSGEVTYIYPN